jgi:hypothetical protein
MFRYIVGRSDTCMEMDMNIDMDIDMDTDMDMNMDTYVDMKAYHGCGHLNFSRICLY